MHIQLCTVSTIYEYKNVNKYIFDVVCIDLLVDKAVRFFREACWSCGVVPRQNFTRESLERRQATRSDVVASTQSSDGIPEDPTRSYIGGWGLTSNTYTFERECVV
jgi:hypothetical protein